MLNNLEEIAQTGHFENGNSVHFYVSQLDLDTTHSYIYADPNTHLSLLKGFTGTDIFSTDLQATQRIQTWIRSLQRTSILISETAEVQRLRFFEKQREVVNTLV
ncbi:MAG: hypothetical protein LIO97_04940 [Tannerellaceae bacterium]|nr:hypothetical protein [Tannerellaceae bacterium]